MECLTLKPPGREKPPLPGDLPRLKRCWSSSAAKTLTCAMKRSCTEGPATCCPPWQQWKNSKPNWQGFEVRMSGHTSAPRLKSPRRVPRQLLPRQPKLKPSLTGPVEFVLSSSARLPETGCPSEPYPATEVSPWTKRCQRGTGLRIGWSSTDSPGKWPTMLARGAATHPTDPVVQAAGAICETQRTCTMGCLSTYGQKKSTKIS